MERSLKSTSKELEWLREELRNGIHSALELKHAHYIDFVSSSVPGGREKTYQLTSQQIGEYARDNKGADLPVLEIISGRGWRVLVGISVTWAEEAKNRYRFVGSQLIIFLDGTAGRDVTQSRQVLRLEWEALDLNDNYIGDIAHPHWQIDLAGFATVSVEEPQDAFASAGAIELLDTPTLDSFAPPPGVDLAWSSKLHLAAAARWMDTDWNDARPAPHVSGPQSIEQLKSWVIASCRYLNRQARGAFAE